ILSFSLNYAQSQIEPFDYHLVNILIHLVNVVLVFAFVQMITKNKFYASIIVAGFFAIHPMHVESVAWVSERKDVLYTFFFFLGLLCFGKYQRNGSLLSYVGALLLMFLSLLSKSAAVIFPMVLLCMDYLMAKEIKWKLAIEKIPFLILSIIFGLVAMDTQSGAVHSIGDHTIIDRVMFASYGFMAYIYKLFLPLTLCSYYPYPREGEAFPIIYYIVPVLSLLIGASCWYFRKHREYVFGVLFYFFTVALVLQFISLGACIISERYSYVPYVGLLFIVGTAYHRVHESVEEKIKKWKMPFAGILILGFIVMSYTAHERTKVWENSATLWGDVIETFPTAHGAYNSRGNFFLDNGNPQAAMADYIKAIELKPNYDDAYNNLGNLYRQNKQYELAISNYNKALQLSPKNYMGYNNRGNAYFNLKKYDLAIADYQKSVELKPNYAVVYGNLGALYFEVQQFDKAIADLTKALSINPDYYAASLNRAVTYSVLGNHELARQDYDYYLRYMPNNAQATNWRGLAYMELGNLNAAVQDFSRAIQLNPQGGEYYFKRAQCLKSLGNHQQAKADALQAQKLGYPVPAEFLQ
ncbi:MAG: tetratricopeptide repeat protein, partial [Flavobacteriales bacterium]|nr:tetratricopeptide repeat protein [Flavobacteriales bacterium]